MLAPCTLGKPVVKPMYSAAAFKVVVEDVPPPPPSQPLDVLALQWSGERFDEIASLLYRRQTDAALGMQRIARGHLGRVAFVKIKAAAASRRRRQQQSESASRVKAVVTIQRVFRGHTTRRRLAQNPVRKDKSVRRAVQQVC